MLGVLFIVVILSALVALMGINRKLGFWGYFFASMLLSPLIGFLLVLASDPRRPGVDNKA